MAHMYELLYDTPIGQFLDWISRGHIRSFRKPELKQCVSASPNRRDLELKPGGMAQKSDAIRLTGRPMWTEACSVAIGADSWYELEDPANPRNWSVWKRSYVVGVICLYTFVVYAGSCIYIIGLPNIQEEFQITEQAALLGLSLYVFAYGLGPMIWAPTSELDFIGRSPVYASTFVGFLAISFLTATTKSWTGYLVLRFFQAFLGSPCLANGGASMGDLFPERSLPYALTIWIAAAYCGPALGPLIAGYVVPTKGWRWGMWEIAWLAAPTCVLILLLPETHGPTIRARKARSLRHFNNQAIGGASQQSSKNALFAMVQAIGSAIIRPIQIATLNPAITVSNLYTSFVYGTYYTLFDAIPMVYPARYGFNSGQLGLIFLSVFAACVLAGIMYCAYVQRVLNPALSQGRLTAEEERLRPALIAVFLPPIGLFLFGWTADGSIHWIVSTLGITVYSMGTFVVLQCLSVYIPRIYPEYAASLFASNDFCRSSLATGAIHFGVPLYQDLGIARGVSVLGGLSSLGILGMWFIYWKGASLRNHARFVGGI